MPVDYYSNLSEAELLPLLATLQQRQTSGIITQSSIAGFESSRSFGHEMSRNETEIRRVLYSLSLRNPSVYPNPYDRRITRTRARYTFS